VGAALTWLELGRPRRVELLARARYDGHPHARSGSSRAAATAGAFTAAAAELDEKRVDAELRGRHAGLAALSDVRRAISR
jgi:hypothetical protein